MLFKEDPLNMQSILEDVVSRWLCNKEKLMDLSLRGLKSFRGQNCQDLIFD